MYFFFFSRSVTPLMLFSPSGGPFDPYKYMFLLWFVVFAAVELLFALLLCFLMGYKMRKEMKRE